MNRRRAVIALIALTALTRAESAVAQPVSERFQVAGHIATATSGEFDETDVGIGGRLAWLPSRVFGVEAELTHYPSDYPDGVAFSRARWEGLFGVTVGWTFDRVRPFGKVRPGFLNIREAPAPIACIAIFPPPLACTLASGETLFAFDVGGGVDLPLTSRTFIRVDVGDRLVRYKGPVFDQNRTVREDSFFGHDFRFAAGAGVRF
jgi:hypothetical protein